MTEWFLTAPLILLGSAGLICLIVFAALLARVRFAERASMEPLSSLDLAARQSPPAAWGIVVFGATALATGPSRELIARLDHAHGLWRCGLGRIIVVSGGTVGEIDEVSVMAEYLREAGVPLAAIVLGRPGANTRQTCQTIARISAELDTQRWIAVSTPFHARRIRDEARRNGLCVIVSGPVSSPEMQNAPVHRARLVTEVLATAFYALPPYITQRIRTSKGTWRHSLPLGIARVFRRSGSKARSAGN